MIIGTEKKATKQEAVSLTPSSKEALAAALRKFQFRRVDIFLVGQDRYLIEDGRFVGKAPNIYYWRDGNGLICGFDVRMLSDKIGTVNDTLWSFHIGCQEVELIIS